MRSWQLCIGGIGIDVSTDVPACIPMLEAMLALYSARQSGAADLEFGITADNGGMTLTVGDEVLWQGPDAAETVAGFEVHFYAHTLADLQPIHLSIHAAAVDLNGRALCLAGVSGAGKSSLCTAALLDGAGYLSDEFSLLTDSGQIEPFPRPLQWGKQRHPAFRHAELQSAGFKKFRFHFPDFRGKTIGNLLWLPPRTRREAETLAAIVFPTYRADTEATAQPLLRSQALMEISQHMHHRLSPARMIAELNRRIPADCLFLRLPFNDARQAWKTLKTALESSD